MANDSVLELRQYTLHPGKRDTLIDIFEREFVESHEALGMTLVGLFRDADDSDRFVWIRGFKDMPSRAKALADFYGGPVWQAHRDAANATMIDSDDVLLLRYADPQVGFNYNDAESPLFAAQCFFDSPEEIDEFLETFEQMIAPALAAKGSALVATLRTEYAANTFPALPIREDENAVVLFTRHADYAARQRYVTALTGELEQPPEILNLIPTSRSRLR